MQEKVFRLINTERPAQEEYLQMNCWEDEKIRDLVNRFGIGKSLGLVYLVSWVPLMLLTIFTKEGMPDLATHIRFLISLPLLLSSFPVMVKKQNWTLRHLQETELLDPTEKSSLDKILKSTDRLMNSEISRAVFLGISYATAIWTYLSFQKPNQHWSTFNSPGGWYFHLILQPLYQYIVLRILFHLFLRFKICFHIARLKLNIRPAHGDGIGGLGFLSTTLVVLSLPAFALSTSSAAGAANLIVHNFINLDGLKVLASAYAAIIVGLLVFPLFLFVPPLLRARADAIDLYGVLAGKQMGDFYHSWLNRMPVRDDSLGVGDFSAVTDYGSEVGRVHSMRLIPVKPRDVVILLMAIAVPFFFVFSLKVSWKVLLSGLFSLLR